MKAPSTPTTIAFARGLARQRWAYASPYRVGIIVGQLCLVAVCPYTAGSRGANCYAAGLAWGRQLGPRAGA